jgi:hypothetical protein
MIFRAAPGIFRIGPIRHGTTERDTYVPIPRHTTRVPGHFRDEKFGLKRFRILEVLYASSGMSIAPTGGTKPLEETCHELGSNERQLEAVQGKS